MLARWQLAQQSSQWLTREVDRSQKKNYAKTRKLKLNDMYFAGTKTIGWKIYGTKQELCKLWGKHTLWQHKYKVTLYMQFKQKHLLD